MPGIGRPGKIPVTRLQVELSGECVLPLRKLNQGLPEAVFSRGGELLETPRKLLKAYNMPSVERKWRLAMRAVTDSQGEKHRCRSKSDRVKFRARSEYVSPHSLQNGLIRLFFLGTVLPSVH